MQGQRSTVDSLPETFEFDITSSSGSRTVDPQVCWDEMSNRENLSNYMLAPDQSHAPFENAVSTENGGLNGWNLANTISSGLAIASDNDLHEVKTDHDWMPLAVGSSNIGEGERSDESRSEADYVQMLDNANANISGNHTNTELNLFPNRYTNGTNGSQSLGPVNVSSYSNNNAGSVNNSMQHSEAGTSDAIRSSHSAGKQILLGAGSSCSQPTSSSATEHALEEGDSRRLSYKRKNIGGVPSQSFGASSSVHQSEGNIPQVLDSHLNLSRDSSISSLHDNCVAAGTYSSSNVTARVGNVTNSVASERNYSILGDNAENAHRNFRLRMNPLGQHSANLVGQHNPSLIRATGSSVGNLWHQPLSSLLPPPVHGMPAMASMNPQMHAHLPIISGLPQYASPVLINVPPNARPPSTPIMLSDRFTVLRDEANMGNLLRNNPSEPLMGVRNDLGSAQGPTYWGWPGGIINSQGNMASNSQFGPTPGGFPLMPPAMMPLRVPYNQSQLSLEFIRQSIAANHSSSTAQSNAHPHQPGQLNSLHAMVPGRAIRLRSQQPQLRIPGFTDGQSDAVNVSDPSLLRRERRTRMLSELRTMLGVLRRNGNLRYENVIFDHSAFLGAVDLHDRHRDMRLDVDNMSYEELLALEERIGTVSTGLSEDAALKCLKQRKYLAAPMGESSEVEPCSICQEDYTEGEEIGRLDCGHDFHSTCVKQWLMQKNMCPICKAAALAT